MSRSDFDIKHAALLISRLLLVAAAMLVAFMVSATLVGSSSTAALSPHKASEAGLALLSGSVINALVLAYLILHARWHGPKLIAALIVVEFGVETFMSQIETLYFISSVQIPMDLLGRTVAMGFLRAVIFAPLAVLILGRWRSTAQVREAERLSLQGWDWLARLALLAIVYVAVYFVFGYFVAWQSSAVRQYYSGSTDILPFWTHLWNTLQTDPVLPLFQVLRGGMWAAIAYLIVRMMQSRRWVIALGIALNLAVLLASGVLFPNPYMPDAVRQAHLFELTSSMFTYGLIAAWIWTRPTFISVAISDKRGHVGVVLPAIKR